MRQREIIALEKRKAKAKAKREKEKLEKKEKEKKKKRAEIERRKKKNKEKRLKKKRIYEKKVRQKKKEEMIEKLKASGDRLGYFRIIITEGGERVKTLSRTRTLLDAYDQYNSYISENKESVIGPKKYINVNGGKPYDVNTINFEILLVENVGEGNTYKTSFREEGGKYVESKIVDSEQHVILAKHMWMVPEYYTVYGYNPINDKKTGKWIYDNIVMHDISKIDHEMVILFNQRILVQRNDDIDIVTCRYIEDAENLFNHIRLVAQKEKNITFLEHVPQNVAYRLNKKIEEKTGWGKKMLIFNAKHVSIVPQVEHKIESLT